MIAALVCASLLGASATEFEALSQFRKFARYLPLDIEGCVVDFDSDRDTFLAWKPGESWDRKDAEWEFSYSLPKQQLLSRPPKGERLRSDQSEALTAVIWYFKYRARYGPATALYINRLSSSSSGLIEFGVYRHPPQPDADLWCEFNTASREISVRNRGVIDDKFVVPAFPSFQR